MRLSTKIRLALALLFAAGPCLATTWTEMPLFSFTRASGSAPQAAPARGPGGTLYGTTYLGGSADAGVIYALYPTGTYRVLHNFTNGNDGAYGTNRVLLDAQHDIYGLEQNGIGHDGVVFRLAPGRHLTVLHSFSGSDGINPHGGLIADSNGNLYGVAFEGGSTGFGTVYRVGADGTFAVIHNFSGGADGANPDGALVRDAAGNLYGTAETGGAFQGGVLFRIAPDGTETVLHAFAIGAVESNPKFGVVADAAGNLYGVTVSKSGSGSELYKWTMKSGRFQAIYGFSGTVASGPPLLAGNHTLICTTIGGGANGAGAVVSITPQGTESLLYSFRGASAHDGQFPEGGVIRDPLGNLYGTTNAGGLHNLGLLYKLVPGGTR